MAHYELSPQNELFLFLLSPLPPLFMYFRVIFNIINSSAPPPLMGPTPGTPQELSAPINCAPTQISPGRGAEL